MSQGAHDSVRDAVLRRLDLLDRAAGHADPRTLLPLARVELNRLADGWRLLLTVHQRDEEGRCRACPAGLRGRRWPCPVWRMAHEQLIGEGVPHRRRTRPLRNPFGRTGRVRRPEPESDAEKTVQFPPIRHRLPRQARP
ncbi:MAG TPA: hypothetical protein VGX25_30825 [Actinophytocola sp.]|uniref:hypothetical protein n=1 Tax=Actinophytocola sp. TaxID=1872138 RepID=UPI002DDD4132|nr:hypothetical protein [Actinophytocola sp.]HEV2783803.1 hypothetical protein [Actinophytocola sp.]